MTPMESPWELDCDLTVVRSDADLNKILSAFRISDPDKKLGISDTILPNNLAGSCRYCTVQLQNGRCRSYGR